MVKNPAVCQKAGFFFAPPTIQQKLGKFGLGKSVFFQRLSGISAKRPENRSFFGEEKKNPKGAFSWI